MSAPTKAKPVSKSKPIPESSSTTVSDSATPPRKHWLYGALAIALTTLIAYSNSFTASFHLDDARYINDDLKEVFSDGSIGPGKSRSLGTLTFALNYLVHEKAVFGYHLVNLSIHILNATLVMYLTWLLLATPRLKALVKPEHRMYVSVISGLWFGVHPVTTMAVTYIIQRYASLATTFYLVAMVLFLWIRLKKQSSIQLKTGVSVAIGVVLMLGLHVKEIVASAPLMMVMVEVMLVRSKLTKKFLALVTGVLVAIFGIGLGLATWLYRWDFILGVKKTTMGEVMLPYEFWLTQFRSIIHYLQVMVVPLDLQVDRYVPVLRSVTEPWVIAGVLVVLSLLVISVMAWKRFPILLVSFAWVLIGFSVTSAMPMEDVYFEHHAYLPLVGVVWLGSIGLYRALSKTEFESYLAAAIVIGLLGIWLTFARNQTWQTEQSLWSQVIRQSPKKPRGYVNYAVAVHSEGKLDIALANYQKALELDPDRLTALANSGVIYAQLGQYDKAEEYFGKVLEINPDYIDGLMGMGVIRMNQGRIAEAKVYFERIRAIDPDNVALAKNWAIVHSLDKTGQ